MVGRREQLESGVLVGLDVAMHDGVLMRLVHLVNVLRQHDRSEDQAWHKSERDNRATEQGTHAAIMGALPRERQTPAASLQQKGGQFDDLCWESYLRTGFVRLTTPVFATVAGVKARTSFDCGGWVAVSKGSGGMDVTVKPGPDRIGKANRPLPRTDLLLRRS